MIYHFHAIAQTEPGTVQNMDGVITPERAIESYEDYMDIKRQIIAKYGPPVCDVVICSLTVLSANV